MRNPTPCLDTVAKLFKFKNQIGTNTRHGLNAYISHIVESCICAFFQQYWFWFMMMLLRWNESGATLRIKEIDRDPATLKHPASCISNGLGENKQLHNSNAEQLQYVTIRKQLFFSLLSSYSPSEVQYQYKHILLPIYLYISVSFCG